jgi:GAF domain-containing protein/anti-sigma regulatory factor (Ser/Thr protein kinase)
VGEPDVLPLGSSADAVPQARQYVSRRLSAENLSHFADDAELAVTELVTNALLHAAPPVSLRVTPADGHVRVEVRDGSRVAPVRGQADVASMTGRGLALVEALAVRWGVDPTPAGKVVWAELGPEQDAGPASDFDGDVEALLSAWADDEPAELRYSIHLGPVPTDLLLQAKGHVDSLVREFELASSGASTGSTSSVPRQLAQLIDDVVRRFAEVRLAIKRQAMAAAGRGEDHTDLTLNLPGEAADDAEAYLAALDEADAYARASRLLTLETPPQHRTFRRWYVSTLVEQLRARAADRVPPPPETFEQRVLAELGAEATLRASLERIAGLQSVTAALAGAANVEEVAQVVVIEGVRTLGAVGGGLLLPDDRGRLSVPSSVGYGDRLLHRLRTEPQDAELPAAEALRTGKPVWLESPQERDERYPGLIGMEPGTASLCAVPLVSRHRRLGALRFSFSEPRLFDEYERRFVLGLADQTAQAIDRALLYDAERGARERAESLAARLVRLQQVATELGDTRTVPEAARVVVTHAADSVGARLATVSLLVDDATLEVVETRGVRPEVRERYRRYPVAGELPGSEAVRTGQPVLVRDVEELERRYPELAGQAEEENSLVCVPMKSGNHPVGVISLSFASGREIGTRAELAFLSSLADTCAQAIERARAVSELHTAVTKLSFLAEATSELTRSLDYRKTLATIATLVVPRLADWCSVHLLTEDGSIEPVTIAHADPEKVTFAERLQQRYPDDPEAATGVPQVIRTGRSELYSEITDEMLVAGARDEEHLRIARELGLSSALIVPLRGDGETVGAVALFSAESGRHYDEDDLAFVEDIAARAGAAVVNARRYERRDEPPDRG